MTPTEVRMWGRTIGAVAIDEGSDLATFQYNPAFAASGIQVAPLRMPLREEPYSFPALSRDSFHGLPGMLADSLPDRFGNALINAWLAARGRTTADFNAVERLCYIGTRGMGALEFRPVHGPRATRSHELHVDELVALASEALSNRDAFAASLKHGHEGDMVHEILLVGTSAGGNRAKALIAYNPTTGAVRSGQVNAGPGFEYWLLKFDGVSGDKALELQDPQGYCAIEFAYSQMARACGIDMTECRLLEENGRRHFMTKRFDRLPGHDKLHLQSLAALDHLDFNLPGANSYEQAFLVIRQLDLGTDALEQMFRRMVFNIVGRNQDDHVKNIAFLMDRAGTWNLAPAYDMTYAYNPAPDKWTRQHQMSLNGKRDDFTLADFVACGRAISLRRGFAEDVVKQTTLVVEQWPDYAHEAGVLPEQITQIRGVHRLDLLSRRAAA